MAGHPVIVLLALTVAMAVTSIFLISTVQASLAGRAGWGEPFTATQPMETAR